MTFSIQAPAAPSRTNEPRTTGSDISIDSDEELKAVSSVKHKKHAAVITPGELVTDDPQWMRCDSSHYNTLAYSCSDG